MTQEQKLDLYNKAKEAYYNGTEIMSDYEFDNLEKELGLENKSNVGSRHNPSYTIEHPFVMGSLSKLQIHEKDGKINWQDYFEKLKSSYLGENLSFILTPKYDGCSFELYFENGSLKSISTRGDGKFGKDIYKQLIGLISEDLLNKGAQYEKAVFRGEVLVKKSIFEKKYSEFVNPRSFVSGILNRDYNESDKEYYNDLSLVIYDARIWNGTDWLDMDFFRFEEISEYLPTYYLIRPISNSSHFENYYKFFEKIRNEKIDFALDGFVIKPIDVTRLPNLENSRPKDCVAIKFVPQLQETVVTDIKWNLGKTHELIPIIYVEPVEMDGKQISKCAGHNYGYLIDNKISKGTKVILSLAGDIIPFLYKVTNTDDYSENKINFPSEYITEINGCHLNAILDKKSINKKQFIDSVISLNIPSIGPAGAKKIFEYLESISSDAETLDFFGEEEKELPNNILLISPEEVYYGIGSGKSGTSAKNSFKKILKNITLKDIILSNNFRFCGGKAAEQVEKYLTDQSYDFNHLAGQSYEWAKNSESDNFKQLLKILNYLGKSFDDFKERAKEIASEDENKIPVILTGEPNDYESKSMFLKCHPEYRMTGSWKEVQIVFTNSLESNTGKMKKAREKNIEIRLY